MQPDGLHRVAVVDDLRHAAENFLRVGGLESHLGRAVDEEHIIQAVGPWRAAQTGLPRAHQRGDGDLALLADVVEIQAEDIVHILLCRRGYGNVVGRRDRLRAHFVPQDAHHVL